jgi:tRNA(fMet)-specific endonuclease VapC
MTAFMLDTNILSAMMREPKGPCANRVRKESENDLFTSVIVQGEVLFGIRKLSYVSHSKAMILQGLLGAILNAITVLPVDTKVCEMYGQLRAGLAYTGKLIGPNDLWIASHALAANCTFVTGNMGEFTRVPDLTVQNWLHG